MIRFELDSATSMVRARQQRPMPDVKNGNAIATSVADNYISPFIAAFKIEAYSPDSTAVVIKVNDIFNGKTPASTTSSPTLISEGLPYLTYHVLSR